MAAYFVRSSAGGAGTGADWANAYTTLAAAFSSKSGGDIFWVADDHAETQASDINLTGSPSGTLPYFVYCVDHTKASPGTGDLKTTATISTTGNTGIAVGQGGTNIYFYGITFNSGSSSGTSFWIAHGGGGWIYYDTCVLNLDSTGYMIVNNGEYLTMLNTSIQTSNAARSILTQGGNILWKNTASPVLGGTLPTQLIIMNGSLGNNFLIGLDLSVLGSGKTIFGQAGGDYAMTRNFIADCKLGSSVTVAAAPSIMTSMITTLVRCDSGATNYRTEKYMLGGTQTVNTSIVRTGGASDGTTPISWQVATTADPQWLFPFESIPISIWNSTVGSTVTATVHATSNLAAGAFPNTDDIWIDVEYLGSSSTPIGSFATNTKANNLASGSAYTNDSASWSGSPAGGTFAMSKSFTPQMAGPINVIVKCAKVSKTFYIDPLVVLS